jgi:hypothetical protein
MHEINEECIKLNFCGDCLDQFKTIKKQEIIDKIKNDEYYKNYIIAFVLQMVMWNCRDMRGLEKRAEFSDDFRIKSEANIICRMQKLELLCKVLSFFVIILLIKIVLMSK